MAKDARGGLIRAKQESPGSPERFCHPGYYGLVAKFLAVN
ncbi:hypothetical protein HMPREF1862_01241 [Varibaculum cambriense]|uniref:Uncharacterized protein n=1 Tax=Varibaculum cambriense TaxID=184870 RepID=A0AB34WYV0_9ACTO|nr:hypothetical protein HMPREF1862_01241 [Varibaculum cambriense]